jgi:adenine-specific DNA-methyltransferase
MGKKQRARQAMSADLETMRGFEANRAMSLPDPANLDELRDEIQAAIAAAHVDTALVLFQRGAPTGCTVSEMRDGIEVFASQVGMTTIAPPAYIIQISSAKDPESHKLFHRIELGSQSLGTLCSVSTGLKAYQTGKGKPPQTDYEKEQRMFHALSPRDTTYGRYLEGADVRRYFLGWSGEYLSYGDWLAEPRRSVPFSGERLLVRQIPAKPPYLVHAVFTDEAVYNDINSMVVFTPVPGVSLKYLLGVINSRLLSAWFLAKFDKLQRSIFPQFKVKELASFPIWPINQERSGAIAVHDQMVTLVEHMLVLHKLSAEAKTPQEQMTIQRQIAATDRQIDRLVYQLYALTNEEIALVEGATPR